MSQQITGQPGDRGSSAFTGGSGIAAQQVSFQAEPPPSMRLFTACFIALISTAFGFIFRAMIMNDWKVQFGLTETQKGEIFGVGLWPFAISIVLFSLIIDRIGYGIAMGFAFVCQIASAVITICAPLMLAGGNASPAA